jgi:predicted RND superfamily exporter protein
MGTMMIINVLVDAPPAGQEKEFNAFLEDVRALQHDLETLPQVTGTVSIGNVLDFVMSTRPDRAQALESVAAKLLATLTPVERLEGLQAIQPGLVGGFWNRDKNQIRITVQARPVRGAEAKHAFFESIESLARKRFPTARAAGVDILLTYMVESLLSDQWITFAISIAAIVVMMTVAFRDWRLGLMALVPNAAPILFVLGVMGWANLKVNMATAMLASVSMGMTVDFSIHYLYRFRLERRKGKSIEQALRDAHGSVGLAMVLANVALMSGFLTLTISAFVPTVHFGILVSVAMLGGLVGNLTALPLALRLLARWDERSMPTA